MFPFSGPPDPYGIGPGHSHGPHGGVPPHGFVPDPHIHDGGPYGNGGMHQGGDMFAHAHPYAMQQPGYFPMQGEGLHPHAHPHQHPQSGGFDQHHGHVPMGGPHGHAPGGEMVMHPHDPHMGPGGPSGHPHHPSPLDPHGNLLPLSDGQMDMEGGEEQGQWVSAVSFPSLLQPPVRRQQRALGGFPTFLSDPGESVSVSAGTAAAAELAERPTVVRFDPHEELVWVATNTGRLISFLVRHAVPSFERFTAFQAHDAVSSLSSSSTSASSAASSSTTMPASGAPPSTQMPHSKPTTPSRTPKGLAPNLSPGIPSVSPLLSRAATGSKDEGGGGENEGGQSDQSVHSLLFDAGGVLSASRHQVQYHTRGGVRHMFLDLDEWESLTATNPILAVDFFVRHPNGRCQLMAGGKQKKLWFLDIVSGRRAASLDLPHGIRSIATATEPSGKADDAFAGPRSKPMTAVLLGGVEGSLTILDPRISKTVATFESVHSEGGVTRISVDSEQRLVATSGARSSLKGGMPDLYVKVFDLRCMRTGGGKGGNVKDTGEIASIGSGGKSGSGTSGVTAVGSGGSGDDGVSRPHPVSLGPVLCPTGALGAVFHPNKSGELFIASANGSLQVSNLKIQTRKEAGGGHQTQKPHAFSPSELNTQWFRIQGPRECRLTDFAISSTGELQVFCEASGLLHVYQKQRGAQGTGLPIPRVNAMSQTTEMPPRDPHRHTRRFPIDTVPPSHGGAQEGRGGPKEAFEPLCPQGFPHYEGKTSFGTPSLASQEIDSLPAQLIQRQPSHVQGRLAAVLKGLRFHRRTRPPTPLDSLLSLPSTDSIPLTSGEKERGGRGGRERDRERETVQGLFENLKGWQRNSYLYGVAKIQEVCAPRQRQRSDRDKGRQKTSRGRNDSGSGGGDGLMGTDGTRGLPGRFAWKGLVYDKMAGAGSNDLSGGNATPFAGIENGTSFDFTHGIVQAFFFSPSFRKAVVQHNCDREFCLACELAFLFHMLELASLEPRVFTCQATNFQRALQQAPEALQLGLLDEPSREITSSSASSGSTWRAGGRGAAPLPGMSATDLLKRVTSFVQFLLSSIHKELANAAAHAAAQHQPNEMQNESPVSALLGFEVLCRSVCAKSGHSSSNTTRNFVLDLALPSSSSSSSVGEKGEKEPREKEKGTAAVEEEKRNQKQQISGSSSSLQFCDLVAQSLDRWTSGKTHCRDCKAWGQGTTRKTVHKLPRLLLVNCLGGSVPSSQQVDAGFWRQADFISPELFVAPSVERENGKTATSGANGDEGAAGSVPSSGGTAASTGGSSNWEVRKSLPETSEEAKGTGENVSCEQSEGEVVRNEAAEGGDNEVKNKQRTETNGRPWTHLQLRAVVSMVVESGNRTGGSGGSATGDPSLSLSPSKRSGRRGAGEREGQGVEGDGNLGGGCGHLVVHARVSLPLPGMTSQGNTGNLRVNAPPPFPSLPSSAKSRDRDRAQTGLGSENGGLSGLAMPGPPSEASKGDAPETPAVEEVDGDVEEDRDGEGGDGKLVQQGAFQSPSVEVKGVRSLRVDTEGEGESEKGGEKERETSEKIARGDLSISPDVAALRQRHRHLLPPPVELSSPESAASPAAPDERWILLNDHRIYYSDAAEALDFSPEWRVPVFLLFERAGEEEGTPKETTSGTRPPPQDGNEPASTSTYGLSPNSQPQQNSPPPLHNRNREGNLSASSAAERKSVVSLAAFMADENLALAASRAATFTRLTEDEMDSLLSGELTVALDAEFVALQLEKAEIREDGTKVVLQPAELSLARVSVLRGDGELEGVPFLDHYIATQEPVKDYLTRFSGLKAGDLDPFRSQHWLTTKKSIYQKLRFLVDLGCKFVGHGLQKDFRIINIVVPSSQVIDTVELFSFPGQRKMSLKFLAAHLLGLFVQVGSSVSVSVSGRHFLPLSQQQQKLQQPHHRDPPGGTEGGAEGGGAGTERGEAEAFTASPKKVSSGCPPPFPEGASQQQLSHLQVPPGTPPFSFPPASAASASASSAAAVVVSHHPPNAPPSRCSSADRGDLSGISTRQVSGGNQQTSSSVLTSQPQSLGAQGPSQTSSLGGHDSVEDARAALALYKHYLKLQAEGRVESTIRQLYDIGYKTNWKVPWQMQQPDLVGS